MNDKLSNDLVDMIKEEIDHIKFLARQAGITNDSLYKMLEGKGVEDCPYCETRNLYEVFYSRKHNWSMYECESCEKSWYVDWIREGEKFKLKKD
tara:strand:- start:2654 stop:2935 length:282 start_codon:yes stop_codon:yes gene_type:complete